MLSGGVCVRVTACEHERSIGRKLVYIRVNLFKFHMLSNYFVEFFAILVLLY